MLVLLDLFYKNNLDYNFAGASLRHTVNVYKLLIQPHSYSFAVTMKMEN